MTRLTALADGIISGRELQSDPQHAREVERLLPMSDLVDSQEVNNTTQNMRMHVPEVSPLCSQGVDSAIAVVDIFSQALAALGTAAITLTIEH